MLIRECRSGDIEALERHLPTRPSGVHAQHFAQQEAGRWSYLVAYIDEMPAGVCVIRWEGWTESQALSTYPDCPELTNLQVHTARRRLGVGTALIRSAEERARARGYHRLGIAVAEDNPKAAALYARLGFADTGLRAESRYLYPDDHGRSQEVVEHNALLVKDLRGPENDDLL